MKKSMTTLKYELGQKIQEQDEKVRKVNKISK